MGAWYIVRKRINNRLYLYWQRTYRVGKSVKTENKYIGPSRHRGEAITAPSSASQYERTVAEHRSYIEYGVFNAPAQEPEPAPPEYTAEERREIWQLQREKERQLQRHFKQRDATIVQ